LVSKLGGFLFQVRGKNRLPGYSRFGRGLGIGTEFNLIASPDFRKDSGVPGATRRAPNGLD
jgi:hypothetical protein